MATPNALVSMETPISVRVSLQGVTRKFKIPLGDLTPQVLPAKLSFLLGIPANQTVIFERYSDSAAAYVVLDPTNHGVYKTLFRAAKAKLKLRLKASVPSDTPSEPICIPIPAIPTFEPLGGLTSALASAFPEFGRFGSETTLNTVQPSTPAQTSTETLVPVVVNGSTAVPEKAEAPPAEITAQAAPKRMSSRLNHEGFIAELASLSRQREMALRTKAPTPATAPSWSVFCNACDKPMSNEHYHCDTCDDGDYDLCANCVDVGIHCPGEHWLIKRFVMKGQVVSSSTERLAPKAELIQETAVPEMPCTYHVDEKNAEDCEHDEDASRTCNCCVQEFKENIFVTCLNCEDYDLCFGCHSKNKHGHHPGHAFTAVAKDTPLSPMAEFMCNPGRNTKHAALCDGCDKPIFGVRNKCLQCPDWDYCSECIKNAALIHPGHRFASLFEPLAVPRVRKPRHVGIYCDGPLCENKHDYVEGVRYKCAICHDTDFCGKCEAYPHNKHNHTHPLIQFKTPIRNATITTVHEDQFGNTLAPKGDRHAPKAESSKTPANAATQVQTIVDVKPAELPAYKPSKERIEIKDLLAEPISEKIKVQDLLSTPVDPTPVNVSLLNALFVRETVLDGSIVGPGQGFSQVWTIRNPGPHAWPAGCSVRYTGGDNMLNVAADRPQTVEDMNAVTASNVVPHSVQAGEAISFRVLLKSPQTAGTKISYWRLKTADGQAFGHRLWCHIVVNLNAPTATSVEMPAAFPSLSNPYCGMSQAPAPSTGPWQDNLLHQTLTNRREQTRRLASQRAELVKALAEREAKNAAEQTERAEILRKLSTEVHTANKARVSAAKAAVDAARIANQGPVYRSESMPAAHSQKVDTAHVQDWQMQLMLLEQQNKKRLMMARAEHERNLSSMPAAAPAAIPVTVPAPAAVPASVEAPVEAVVETPVAIKEEPKDIAKSNMIFPKLDKESPASSTHDVSAVKVEATPAPISPKSDKSDLEIFEDAESVNLDSSDDGFLTDEEYDILDASDEEIMA